MAKALKVFVVFIFLLSGGALYLGIVLFQQREVMKARTQDGENTLAAIAKNLSATNFNKANLIAATTNDFPKMRKEQTGLAATAKNTWDTLKNTEKDLADTIDRLNQTNATLAATLQTLKQTQDELATTKTEVETQKAEVAKRDGQINELKTAKADLEQQVKDREDKIAKHEETIKDLKDEIKADEEDIKRISAELAGCESHGDEPYIRKGTAGRILKVNDDWNFVVLNIGTNQGMLPNGTMIVHRGDKMLGRVRIAVVNKSMCIATIERDWQQGQIQEGDFVVH
jgi:septal ring factor EnvC (AmiA/AmiB activator)